MRVERLERVVNDELLRREKSEKYTHNMLENLKSQVQEGFERDNITDEKMEVRLATSISAHDSRLKRIELAMATALGGMIILGWLINHAASNILALLSK